MRRTLALFGLLTIGLSFILSAGALTGSIIRGSTRNLTRGQPAVGDDVILIRLDRMLDRRMPMEAEAQTKTDTHGAFLLPVRYPGKAYLVRVLHQGVTYDRQASGGDNLSISVFDAARVTHHSPECCCDCGSSSGSSCPCCDTWEESWISSS